MEENKSPQSQRLKVFIDSTGMSLTEFGKQCNIASSSSLHNVISLGKTPSAKLLDKIVNRFPQLNHDWVLLGYGEMIVKGIQNQPATPNSLQKSQAATYENIEQYLQNHDFAINELANMIKKALIANSDALNTFHNKIANYENTIATEIDKAYETFDKKVLEIKEEVRKEFTTVVNTHKQLIDNLDEKRSKKLDEIQSEVRQNWVRYEAKIDKDLSDFGLMLESSFEDVKNNFKKLSDANTKKAMDFVSKIGEFKKHSNPKPQK